MNPPPHPPAAAAAATTQWDGPLDRFQGWGIALSPLTKPFLPPLVKLVAIPKAEEK